MSDSLTGSALGDYQVHERIGKGGMGEVYRARQISLDRVVAIKVLPADLCADTDYVNRFLHEAKGAARLNHGNIIQIFDAGVSGSIYFYVMEFVEGKNLGQVIKEQGRLSERDALYIIQQTALGLSYAHRMDVVHRDIKPENIMLAHGGRVKIGDLGLAKWKMKQTSSLTEVGATMGTPFYVSPEQIRGISDIDGRADIYSLGMTLYHLLGGRPPFFEGTAAAVMAQHLSDPMPSLHLLNSEVSRPTLDLIEAMTVKDRDDRLQSVDEIVDLLNEWLALDTPVSKSLEKGTGSRARMRSASQYPPDDPWSRNIHTIGKVLSAVLVGLLLAFVILIVVSFYGESPEDVSLKIDPFVRKEVKPSDGSLHSEEPIVAKTVKPSLEGKTEQRFSGLQLAVHSIRSPIPKGSSSVSSERESLIPFAELVVGDLQVKSKTLLRIRSAMEPQKPDGIYALVVENFDRISSAALELTPCRISKGCDLKIEVCQMLKNWSPMKKVIEYPGEVTLEMINGFLLNPMKPGGPRREKIRHYCEVINKETTWEKSSNSRGTVWGKPGASSPNKDYDSTPLANLDLPGESRFHVTSESVEHPIRIDLMPYFASLYEDYKSMDKTESDEEKSSLFSKRRGWIIQPVSGKGEVFFYSNYFGEKSPRIIIRLKNGQKVSVNPKAD